VVAEKNHFNPFVSIIILTYNGSKHIISLLESLSGQSYPKDRIEIIVVDNASTDNTLSLIQNNYPFVNIVPLVKNIGFAAGNNRGFFHASHDLILFLNQDTICHYNWLRDLVAIMEANKGIAACNPNIIPTNLQNYKNVDIKSPEAPMFFCDLSPFGYARNRVENKKQIYYTKLLSGCSFIIRRKIVLELGYLFDEQLWMYAEDTDLSLRLHNLGYKICSIKNSVIYHLHDYDTKIKKKSLYIAARAIMNRIYVYFKNMGGLEFLIFLPILFFGGIFKFFEFKMTSTQRALFFIPFCLFSTACMVIGILRMPKFAAGKRLIMKKRRIAGFPILKLLFRQNL